MNYPRVKSMFHRFDPSNKGTVEAKQLRTVVEDLLDFTFKPDEFYAFVKRVPTDDQGLVLYKLYLKQVLDRCIESSNEKDSSMFRLVFQHFSHQVRQETCLFASIVIKGNSTDGIWLTRVNNRLWLNEMKSSPNCSPTRRWTTNRRVSFNPRWLVLSTRFDRASTREHADPQFFVLVETTTQGIHKTTIQVDRTTIQTTWPIFLRRAEQRHSIPARQKVGWRRTARCYIVPIVFFVEVRRSNRRSVTTKSTWSGRIAIWKRMADSISISSFENSATPKVQLIFRMPKRIRRNEVTLISYSLRESSTATRFSFAERLSMPSNQTGTSWDKNSSNSTLTAQVSFSRTSSMKFSSNFVHRSIKTI